MTLTITLPDNFKEHFDFDRFQDSFMRICGDIRATGILSGNYEYELAEELKKAFKVAHKEVNYPQTKGCELRVFASTEPLVLTQ